MWIVIRIIVTIGALVFRFVSRHSPAGADGTVDGEPYSFTQETDKDGKIKSIHIGLRLKTPVLFKLTREGFWDRLFKSLDLAEEFQTRHAQFDQTIYIACDHITFMGILKENKKARGIILNLFKDGFDSIYSDGENLWMTSTTRQLFTEDACRQLIDLKRAMGPLQKAPPALDPFARKAMVMGSVSLALFAYAAVAIAEAFINPGDSHLDVGPLVTQGLIFAVIIFLLLCVVVFFVFRGSSRGHRIIIENAFLFLISLPAAGVQSLADLNRAFDFSPSIIVDTTVVDKQHYRRKRRDRYYLYPANQVVREGILLPERIRVSEAEFQEAIPGGRMRLEIGTGWLGHPWYKERSF